MWYNIKTKVKNSLVIHFLLHLILFLTAGFITYQLTNIPVTTAYSMSLMIGTLCILGDYLSAIAYLPVMAPKSHLSYLLCTYTHTSVIWYANKPRNPS